MMATFFSNEEFKHLILMNKSAYILIRKSELKIHPELPKIFTEKFLALYDYFD